MPVFDLAVIIASLGPLVFDLVFVGVGRVWTFGKHATRNGNQLVGHWTRPQTSKRINACFPQNASFAMHPHVRSFPIACGEATQDEGLTEWEKYQQKRGMASFDQAQDDYKTVRRTHAFAARAECGSPPVLQPDPSPPHPREPCAHQPMIPRAVQDAHPCRRQ